jgi:hypothetical protein
MNKLFTAAMGLALTATAFTASAQKTFTEGTATYNSTVGSTTVESKVMFKGDSSLIATQQGPATIKILSFKDEYFAVKVDVPVMNMKKAAVATPAELEEMFSKFPSFTFTPSTETKTISGFNCTKVIAKDAKNNTSYDLWITKDITAPASAYSELYAKAGGFPVQFTLKQMGKEVTNTLKSVSDAKLPVGTFGIAGYDKITLSELSAMGGGR